MRMYAARPSWLGDAYETKHTMSRVIEHHQCLRFARKGTGVVPPLPNTIFLFFGTRLSSGAMLFNRIIGVVEHLRRQGVLSRLPDTVSLLYTPKQQPFVVNRRREVDDLLN